MHCCTAALFGGKMHELSFEKLEVFQLAAELVAEVQGLNDRLGRGKARLKDQLHRASMSVLLNIAEGAGEFSPAEKAHFFRIALRSTTECVGCFVIVVKLKWIQPQDLMTAREYTFRIVSMLTKLIHSVETRR